MDGARGERKNTSSSSTSTTTSRGRVRGACRCHGQSAIAGSLFTLYTGTFLCQCTSMHTGTRVPGVNTGYRVDSTCLIEAGIPKFPGYPGISRSEIRTFRTKEPTG
eukprot:840342-Rhodomonas_salina.1